MFFRFGGALILLVLIALCGIAIEKRNLSLRRAISHQRFQQEVLLEQHAEQRLRAHQFSAPGRLLKDQFRQSNEKILPKPIPRPKL